MLIISAFLTKDAKGQHLTASAHIFLCLCLYLCESQPLPFSYSYNGVLKIVFFFDGMHCSLLDLCGMNMN